MSTISRASWISLGLVVYPLFFTPSCVRTEVKGSYHVTLEITGNPRTFDGTLILSTAPLDIPPPPSQLAEPDLEWLGGDTLGANSCFMLAPTSGIEGGPSIVRVFEARISANRVATPIEILKASDLSIRIVSLQFFSNTLGGEIEVQTADGVRAGRLYGARTGSADSLRCVTALEDLRSALRRAPDA